VCHDADRGDEKTRSFSRESESRTRPMAGIFISCVSGFFFVGPAMRLSHLRLRCMETFENDFAEDEAVEFLEDGAETLATRETKSPSGAGGGERKGPDSAETRGGDAKNTPTRTPQAAAAARLTRRKTRRKTRVSSPP
jgi:hypothetical protein